MRFDDWDRFGGFPPPSRPRQAKGGIKATTTRGAFGSTWWARRWIAVLESFQIGARLQRGRSYARKGQVLSIDVSKGAVRAKVQGSRAQPYAVEIQVRPLEESQWKRIAEELSQQAIFAASLLAGEMPQQIEDVFAAARLSLFPEKARDISSNCSCPDWSNPCKHIAAVYYLLGEAFDQDPFLMFRMRGMDREEFTALLGEHQPVEDAPAVQAEPLPASPEEFWRSKPLPPDLIGDVNVSRPLAALPRRLGNLQFWRGEKELTKSLEPVYVTAPKQAEIILFGDKVSG